MFPETAWLGAPRQRVALERYLSSVSGAAAARLNAATPLFGGAVQESWKLEIEFEGGRLPGRQTLVLRADAPTKLAASLSRAQEFAVLAVAHRAGVRAPEPRFCCENPAVLGRPFFVMEWRSGVTSGSALVQDGAATRMAIAMQLAEELAAIHRITPPASLVPLLDDPPLDVAAARLACYRRWLDAFDDPHPVAEWALRWLEHEKPEPGQLVLAHGDFRTGNYLVEGTRVTAILDWEFAAWGEPDEDIGWFCCKSWRFGALEREAGGLVPRETFYRAYERQSGRPLDRRRLHYWEVMASLRWLILALQQRDRFRRGGERSLSLALTGRRAAECEFELLRLIEAGKL